MKKKNLPLIIGGLILIGIIIVLYFGEDLAKVDPYAINLGTPQMVDGKLIMDAPPHYPNHVNLFGTDILGRDIYSQILIGAKITFKIALLVTLFRFIVALPIAFLSGFGEKTSWKLIKFFSTVFSAIPALIISIIVLNLPVFRELELEQSIIAFTIVLTLVGWGRLANVLQDRVKDILSYNFIQGEIAIGKNKFMIALQNVLPHLIASIIVYAFIEMGRALLIIAQLGVFGVYVGKNKLDRETIARLELSIMPSYNPEWGGMLATARYAITGSKVWVALYPALAFFISIAGFNLLGEGLQHELNKRNSMVITWIKRLAFHLSPKTYFHEIIHIKKYKRSFATKTIIIALIIFIPLIPVAQSPYELNREALFNHVKEFDGDQYQGRMLGTKGRDKAVDYIVTQLKAGDVKPLFGDNYIQSFQMSDKIPIINRSEMVIMNRNDKVKEAFQLRENYNFNKWFFTPGNWFNVEEKGKLNPIYEVSAEILTQSDYEKGNYDTNKSYFVILDQDMNVSLGGNYRNSTSHITKGKVVRGLIVPIVNDKYLKVKNIIGMTMATNYDEQKKSSSFDPFTILVDSRTGEGIREEQGETLEISTDVTYSEILQGKNIGGLIEGNSDQEPIYIVTSYDYFGYEENEKYKGLDENATSTAALLEMAKKLAEVNEKPNRSIAFVFLDASKVKGEGAKTVAYSQSMGKDSFYIYVNYLGMKESKSLYMDTSLIKSDDSVKFDYVKYIKKRSRQMDIEMLNDFLSNDNEDVQALRNRGNSGVLIKGLSMNRSFAAYGMPQNDLNAISSQRLKEQAQLILDTIVHFAYKGE